MVTTRPEELREQAPKQLKAIERDATAVDSI